MHIFLLIQINRLVGFRDSCGIEKYHDGFSLQKKLTHPTLWERTVGITSSSTYVHYFEWEYDVSYINPPKRAAIYWIYDLHLSIKKKHVLETHPILPRTLF